MVFFIVNRLLQLSYDLIFDKTLSAVAIAICVFLLLYSSFIGCPKIFMHWHKCDKQEIVLIMDQRMPFAVKFLRLPLKYSMILLMCQIISMYFGTSLFQLFSSWWPTYWQFYSCCPRIKVLSTLSNVPSCIAQWLIYFQCLLKL